MRNHPRDEAEKWQDQNGTVGRLGGVKNSCEYDETGGKLTN